MKKFRYGSFRIRMQQVDSAYRQLWGMCLKEYKLSAVELPYYQFLIHIVEAKYLVNKNGI